MSAHVYGSSEEPEAHALLLEASGRARNLDHVLKVAKWWDLVGYDEIDASGSFERKSSTESNVSGISKSKNNGARKSIFSFAGTSLNQNSNSNVALLAPNKVLQLPIWWQSDIVNIMGKSSPDRLELKPMHRVLKTGRSKVIHALIVALAQCGRCDESMRLFNYGFGPYGEERTVHSFDAALQALEVVGMMLFFIF
jgi:hypothetical protein